MRRLTLVAILAALAVAIGAQPRPFDTVKNARDPFLGEKSGFESLFVNPAGMAGQTQVFSLSLEGSVVGTQQALMTLETMMDNSDVIADYSAMTPTEAQAMAQEVLPLIVENLDQSQIDQLIVGTVLADNGGITAADIAGWGDLDFELLVTNGDMEIIATNAMDNDSELLVAALDDVEFSVAMTAKIGTLIKGFAIGMYANQYALLNAADMGFRDMVGEYGLKAGVGFNLGPLAIGGSADMSILFSHTAPELETTVIPFETIDTLMYDPMVYGIAWGVDVGAQLSLFPWFTIGAVMTDLIGSYQPMGITTLYDLGNGTSPISELSSDYDFSLDVDLGVTFNPDLGDLLETSFSVDYYDFGELIRNPPETFSDALHNHMRLGASVKLFKFLVGSAQYYNEYISLGAGLDIAFFEIYGEVMFSQVFDDVGGYVMTRLYF